jgi:hypothetical protein
VIAEAWHATTLKKRYAKKGTGMNIKWPAPWSGSGFQTARFAMLQDSKTRPHAVRRDDKMKGSDR